MFRINHLQRNVENGRFSSTSGTARDSPMRHIVLVISLIMNGLLIFAVCLWKTTGNQRDTGPTADGRRHWRGQARPRAGRADGARQVAGQAGRRPVRRPTARDRTADGAPGRQVAGRAGAPIGRAPEGRQAAPVAGGRADGRQAGRRPPAGQAGAPEGKCRDRRPTAPPAPEGRQGRRSIGYLFTFMHIYTFLDVGASGILNPYRDEGDWFSTVYLLIHSPHFRFF
jgi:hypothetical protein